MGTIIPTTKDAHMTPYIVVITDGHRLHGGGAFVARWDDAAQAYLQHLSPSSRHDEQIRDAHRIALALNAAEAVR